MSSLNIRIVTPQNHSQNAGNQITAKRWAKILRALSYRVTVQQQYGGEACDLLIALHAKRSAAALRCFHRQHPGKPSILALTGTDLHRDMVRFQSARRSLELATRLVLLEPEGAKKLPRRLRGKVTVIYQSATAVSPRPRADRSRFEVCVSGHLRYVKDPLRCAMAVRDLPEHSRIHVIQIGAAMTERYLERAEREVVRNPRYTWLGELPHASAKRRLARCRLLVLSSRMEGAPSVISEALASNVPIIASRITATIGLLGEDYPGLFPVGDTQQLRALLLKAEADSEFRGALRAACRRRKAIVSPRQEIESWRSTLGALMDV